MFYDVDGAGCDKWSPNPPVDPAFCLNMTRWQQIIAFGQTTGIGIVFGLNGMTRANNSMPANLSNHEAFLSYTAAHKLVRQRGGCRLIHPSLLITLSISITAGLWL